ncbi:MAG: iron-containing alcohol dehydrogenase [Bifidobacterium pseudocatenulatum]
MCIPTSSGTGSEVTPFAVITDHKTGYSTRSPITRDPVRRHRRSGAGAYPAAQARIRCWLRRPDPLLRGLRLRLCQRFHRWHGVARPS